MAVFEHLILPARNKVYWHDGASGNHGAQRALVARTLELRIDPVAATDANPRPQDVVIANTSGGFTLWHDGAGRIEPGPGRASDAAMTPGAYPPMDISGTVSDPLEHYLPRQFAVTLDAVPGGGPVPPAQHLTVPVYPSPQATLFGRGGGLYGQICWAVDQPAAWARVQLSVTGDVPWVYDAQANAVGEFRVSLFRLPPQVALLGQPTATLRIFARNDADPDAPVIAEGQPAASVTAALRVTYPGLAVHPAPVPDTGQALTFNLIHGRVGRLHSANLSHIAIAPS